VLYLKRSERVETASLNNERLKVMFACRRHISRLVAIGASVGLVLAVVGPGVAAACEGAGGEIESEVEGSKGYEKGNDCSFKETVGRTCTLAVDVILAEAMFGVWQEGGEEPAGYTVEKKASCENKSFKPANDVCLIAVKLRVERSRGAWLRIPVILLGVQSERETGRSQWEIKLLNP
jgi:hypothetical protein